MSHKIHLLLGIAMLNIACQSHSNEDIHKEIMVIHDEVMPKQDKLMTLKSSLDSLASISGDSLSIKKIYFKLDSSDSAMMSWMKEYDVQSIKDESKKEYYNSEKKKISDIKELTNNSIEEAELYLKSLNNGK
ncbi:MAG: hypothetical protein KA313_09280 [Pseudarcicella sp.]|nr:hypothetical protein [Pseudarcicella sp.]MBP6411278.1 hypothetical protein [Pseudarcicella sp.]